ncbi:aldo/keto reductase [Amycolatopsis benzoatilytica]|uniref:aldo/keto reductase n=1 Tax=Amycolatopsis benzoatilytica TaxID=346045 RepID=UPI00036349B7|nr:aldo/keto reductase [Amycolatopsis benzoatilytica]
MTATTSPGGTAQLAGHEVARIGYGVMQLGRPGTDRDSQLELLRTAARAGVNHLDTAQFYSDGRCNELIRDAFPSGGQVVVTKVGAEHGPDGLRLAQQPAQLRAQVEANLASLGVDQLDVVNLRRADIGPGLIAEGDQVVDLDDQLAELISLRGEGKIGALGISNVRADLLRQALPAGIACVQNSYNLLSRDAEPVLDLCRENEIAWVPYFPLGSAFDLGQDVTGHPVVTGIAGELGVTPAQVALAWLLRNYSGTLLIAGTATPSHLLENIEAGQVQLPAEAVAALDRLG